MKLSVRDRLLMQRLFPKEADVMTQIIVRAIAKSIEITSEEQVKFGLMSSPDGRWEWSKDADDIDVGFSDTEIHFLRSRVDEADNKKQVTLDMLDLCLKIREAKAG